MSISLFMRRRATICFAMGLAGGSRGPQGEAEVRLLSVGLDVCECWGLGPGRSEEGMSIPSEGRGGRGAGRWGWRYSAVEAERFREVVFKGNGTGLSSMGGGSIGAPGKSTLWLCVRMRAMMVLALADVSFSFDVRAARGVDEFECVSGLDGLKAPKSWGMLFGEHGGDSGW